MDSRGKETKSAPKEKSGGKLLLSFCVLSVVVAAAICLTIALFAQVQTLDREMKTMESKLLQEIQELQEILKKESSVDKEIDSGRFLYLEHNVPIPRSENGNRSYRGVRIFRCCLRES